MNQTTVGSNARPELTEAWARELISRRQILLRGAAAGGAAGAAWLLAACGGTGGAGASGGRAPTSIVVAAVNSPTTFDLEGPNLGDLEAQAVVLSAYDPLIEFKFRGFPDGHREALPTEFESRLAESWTADGDATWTFRLKQGVRSHAGNELTSADVVWLWNVYTPARNGVGAFFKAQIAKIKSVEALDRYTVRFTTDGPAPMFLQVMTTAWARPFDSAEVRKHAASGDPVAARWIDKNVAGFGPYAIQSNQPGSVCVLSRRADYYGDQPYLERVSWQEVPDPSNRLSLLKRGEAHVAESLVSDQLKQVADDPSLHVQSATGNLGLYAVLDTTRAPWTDVRVRQALAWAIPYDQIISDVYAGFARRMRSISVPAYEGYDPRYWVYDTDPERARALVKAAGASGAHAELSYRAGAPEHEQVAIAIKDALAAIGITLALRKVPDAPFFTAAVKGSYPAFLHNGYSWVVPSTIYDALLTKTPKALQNPSHYDNPTLTRLANEGASTGDLAARLRISGEIQQILAHDVPWVPVCNPGQNIAMIKSLTGFSWVPHGVLLPEYLHST